MNILIAYFGIWGFVIMFHKKTVDLFNHAHTAEEDAKLCHNCTEYGPMEYIIWAMVLTRVVPVFCGLLFGCAICVGCCFYQGYFKNIAKSEKVEEVAPEFKLWAGEEEKKKNDATCVICAKNFLDEPERHIAELDCSNKHIFHVDCLTEWVEDHDECPIDHEKIDKEQLYDDEGGNQND